MDISKFFAKYWCTRIARNDLISSAKNEKGHPTNKCKVGMHETVARTYGNKYSKDCAKSEIYKACFDKNN
jgi:hypothetical protein